MFKNPVLLFAALPVETARLRAVSAAVRTPVGGVPGAWQIPSSGIWIVQTGIGAVRARQVAEIALSRLGAGVAVSTGFAGALRKDLTPGDIVLATDTRSSEATFPSDSAWLARYRAAARDAGLGAREGTLWTAGRLLTNAAEKRALASEGGALGVEMEGAGIAAAAERAGIPFVAVRTILDRLDDAVPDGLLDKEGNLRPLRLVSRLARSPMLVATLVSLAAATRRAGISLERLHAAALRTLDRNPGVPGCTSI